MQRNPFVFPYSPNENNREICSNLSELLAAFLNVDKLTVEYSMDDVDMINKVFLESSKGEDYYHFQKIHNLRLITPTNDDTELNIIRYNCPIVVWADGKIIF
jgi:hypothetical protein